MHVVVVIVIVALVGAGLWTIHRFRRPRELRGDWWASFEQQFREYARDPQRQRRDRGSAGR